MCDNRVEYTVPKGVDYKTYDYQCGSTGIRGGGGIDDPSN